MISIVTDDAAHLDQAAVGRILDGVAEQVIEHLAQALLIALNDREIGREIELELVFLGLRIEALDRPRRQLIEAHVVQVEFERALRLNLARRQQILDQHGQPIRFVLDDGGIVAHNLLIPLDIFAPQRGGVTFDQRDGRLEFVRDRRDEDVLHLLRLPEIGDVAHVGDDIRQMSIGSSAAANRRCRC